MSEVSRNPDFLLRQIQDSEAESRRGKLKIYLGSAPGVGKTYKMLQDAYLQRCSHCDVVIGIVDTHGRHAIEKMLKKFTSIPVQVLPYKNKSYPEFDLDAALRRNPSLLLVDEMAHSNIPGLRHEKRWQDIKELLDCGIDVYTTLNVQHIESLKDAVAQIIQAPVKETVPDFMIESAHTVELVDLPIEEHLRRLKEGKIYSDAEANLAATHFFRPGNLIALRELALRVTAGFVESDVMAYRHSRGIQTIWPTRDKILVCVGSKSASQQLIRAAKRLATRLQAEWVAVHIDTPSRALNSAKRHRAIQNLRLAEQLGAVTHILLGKDIVDTVLQFARNTNITQIMVYKDHGRRWPFVWHRRLVDEIIAHCGEINVYIMAGITTQPAVLSQARGWTIPWPYYGLGALLLTFMGFDYYYLPPVYAVTVTHRDSIFAMLALFLVSIGLSYFTLLKQREAKSIRNIQQHTRSLYLFGRQLLQTRGRAAILSLSAGYIAETFQASVALYMGNPLTISASVPKISVLSDKERSIAQWVYDMAQPAGLGTDTLFAAGALYLPLCTAMKKVLGVIRIQPEAALLFSPDQQRNLESCVNQLSLALEIDRLEEQERQKQIIVEVNTAKNTLLKTISTQLNEPLGLILEAIGTVFTPQDNTVPSAINTALNKIKLINNNISQIIAFETANIALTKEWIDLAQLLKKAIADLQKIHTTHTIRAHCPKLLPKMFVDPKRIYTVLINLLDNATQYSLEDSEIDIYMEVHIQQIYVSIENMGHLLEKEDLTKIFNPFYRRTYPNHPDSLGLGLTLCEWSIKAHGGQIWAENIQSKNTIAFRFTLPY